MRPSSLCAVFAAYFLLISPSVSAQDRPPAHPPRPKLVGPAKWAPSEQEVSVTYWTLEPGWSTTLEMRNNVTHHDLTVTPVLRTPTGQETLLPPITIAPQHVVSLNLRDSAAASRVNLGLFGSVAFRFDGLSADNLFAATIVRREGEPIDFHFDGQQAGPTFNSGGIEGMWWLPAASSTDYLILSNPLKKTVTGTLSVSSAFTSDRAIALSLGPGETKRIDLGEALGPSSIGGVGGLSISLPGKELIPVTQIVFDEVTGLAVIMKMFDREPGDQPKSRMLRAPMMALSQPDQGLGFPGGTQLIPRIFLRNAGSAALQVSPIIDWRNQNSGTFALPALMLSPGDVRTISLADYQQVGKIPPDATWGTMKLAYSGRAGDLVAVAVSYDKDSRYGLQTPFSEDLSRLWAGGMWHVDATHNTLITTGNGGTEATAAEVTLFYNGGKSKYRVEKMLSPGQQLWLDLGHLVHDQVPDSDGNTLPPDTMAGSYELRDLDHGYVGQLYEGKLIIDKTYGHAAYGCGSCCGYVPPQFDPISLFEGPNVDFEELIQATNTCSGTVDDVTGSAYGWGSSNTAVATLPNRTLHTVALGSATGSTLDFLQWSHPPGCPSEHFAPKQSIAVQPPTISSISPAQGLVGTAINVTISGTNFAAGANVSAGSNVSVSSVNVTSSTQITATFTPANATSAGGNQAVTVTVAGAPKSNSKNFFVQFPDHFQFVNYLGAPGGKGPIVPVTNGNVVALSGQVLATNYCGVYENFAYEILDQQSNPLLNGTAKGTEVFTNISVPPGPTPTVDLAIDFSTQGWTDNQAYGGTYPSYCLTHNQNQSLDYGLTMTVGSTVYPLATIVHYTKGNFNGTLNVTATITTP